MGQFLAMRITQRCERFTGQGVISGKKPRRDWMIGADEVERLKREFPVNSDLRGVT